MIDPKASDWSDLDLLTIAEVRERLVDEIAAIRKQIVAADQAHANEDAVALRRRLSLLEDRLGQ
jgi:hypothetical protein